MTSLVLGCALAAAAAVAFLELDPDCSSWSGYAPKAAPKCRVYFFSPPRPSKEMPRLYLDRIKSAASAA